MGKPNPQFVGPRSDRWQRAQSQVTFRKRTTNYRSYLQKQKETYTDKASDTSSPPYIHDIKIL